MKSKQYENMFNCIVQLCEIWKVTSYISNFPVKRLKGTCSVRSHSEESHLYCISLNTVVIRNLLMHNDYVDTNPLHPVTTPYI